LSRAPQVVPWSELCALIEPHYPKSGNGRPPVGVARMLRIYFLQQWFNLSLERRTRSIKRDPETHHLLRFAEYCDTQGDCHSERSEESAFD